MTHTIASSETLTFTFERTIRATAEAVFDAWTQPAKVTQWWDPTGAPLVRCTIDARVGGSFCFESAGHAPPFMGQYKHLERPRRLEFEALGAYGTVLITDDGPTTQLRVTIRCASAEHFEKFREIGVHLGTDVTLNNLVTFVEAAPGNATPGGQSLSAHPA